MISILKVVYTFFNFISGKFGTGALKCFNIFGVTICKEKELKRFIGMVADKYTNVKIKKITAK